MRPHARRQTGSVGTMYGIQARGGSSAGNVTRPVSAGIRSGEGGRARNSVAAGGPTVQQQVTASIDDVTAGRVPGVSLLSLFRLDGHACASRNALSENTDPRWSRIRMARHPFGNAACAT